MAKKEDQQVETEDGADDLSGADLLKDARKAGMTEAEIEAIKKAQSEMDEGDEALAKVAGDDDDEDDAQPEKKTAKSEEEDDDGGEKDDDADEEEEEDKDEEEEESKSEEEEKDKDEGDDEDADADKEDDGEEEAKGKKKAAADETEEEADPTASTLGLLPVERFDTAKVTARFDEIRKSKAEINKKLVAGDLDADEATAQIEKLDDERDAIKARIARSEQNAEYNANLQQTLFSQQRSAFLRRAIKEGTDYKDKATIKHFDRAVNMLIEDPEFAKKGLDALDELFDEAHAMVLARTGRTAKKAATKSEADDEPVKKVAADGKKVVKLVPKDKDGKPRSTAPNLATLPTAHKGDEQDDVVTSLQGLSGDELERALARLPAKEVERVMRKLS